MSSETETQQVLQMLSDGKISVDEAHKLLDKLHVSTPTPPPTPNVPSTRHLPKMLRIDVSEEDNNVVNIKVPLKLLKLGVGLPDDLPGGVKSHLSSAGISLDNIGNLSDSEFLEAFEDLSVDVHDADDNTTVRIYCE